MACGGPLRGCRLQIDGRVMSVAWEDVSGPTLACADVADAGPLGRRVSASADAVG